MKLMIASDIHGSAFYCRKLLQAFEKESADRLLLLGDILYHGPRNDLPAEYAPKEVISMLNPLRDRIFCVRGNCDTEVDQMVLDFPVLADYCVIPCTDRLIYATHGHVFNPQTPPPMMKGDILLHGHTHVPTCKSFRNQKGEECWYLNPGSVSIPKEGSPHGYMTVELEMGQDAFFQWKDMDGQIWMEKKFTSIPSFCL